jgi:tetratricopeptide (TPR) repeat protein
MLNRLVPRCVLLVAVLAPGPYATALLAQSVSVVLPASGPAADAWKALEAGRLREAERFFTRALAATPDDTAVLLGSAVVARRLGQGVNARQWLTRALQIDPSLSAASNLLATLSREAGDLETALRVYDAALVRAPDHPDLKAGAASCRSDLARLIRWPGDLGGETRLFFDGPVDEATARLALETAARARERIGSALGVTPADRVTVVLVTTPAASPPVAAVPEWSTGQFDGRVRMQVRPPVKDRPEFERMLTHEYAHAVLRTVAPSGVPAWLNEGLATWLEPGGLKRADRDLREAGVLLPWPRLQESFASLPPAAVTAAYAQSALGVAVMIARAGIPAVLAMMRDLAAGETLDSAMRSRIGLSVEGFQSEFLASLRIP